MNNIFYELLQIAVGARESLSRVLSIEEWVELYRMAHKQAMVGICFAGVKRLDVSQRPDRPFFLKWLSAAASIQKRNAYMTEQTLRVLDILKSDNLPCCVIKGQALAPYYQSIGDLRHSGDIDIWALPLKGESSSQAFFRILNYVRTKNPNADFTQIHADLKIIPDVDVEVHFTPSVMNCPWNNSRMQAWFRHYAETEGLTLPNGINTVSPVFNAVYLLQHCYCHLLFEGVGLRQIMDYYFVVRSQEVQDNKKQIASALHSFGMSRFAGAMMWVLHKVFLLDESLFICPSDEKAGNYFINQIIAGGNFGRYGNARVSSSHANKVSFFFARIRHGSGLLRYFPSEILWSPYMMITHFLRKHLVLRQLKNKAN